MKNDRTSPGSPRSLLKRVWCKAFGRTSWAKAYGTLREKEQHGLLRRANYAYGLLRAADVAKYFGKNATTVCEFGVAEGDGILNMVELAEAIQNETGVEFRIVGFDSGEGLPTVRGYQDHPEIWSVGDFPMVDKEALLRRVNGRAEIIFGDIGSTIDDFTKTMETSAPLGFVSIDVDVYSGTKSALLCLNGDPDLYTPAVSMYFDDVAFFFANEWCGELSAIREFNAEHDLRKIDVDRSLPGSRPAKSKTWYRGMYVCHVLDHTYRDNPRTRETMRLGDHLGFMTSHYLL